MNAMDCTDIKAHLSALVDDAIDAPARYRAERHLAECPECRRLLDQAEVLESLIAADAALREPDLDPMAGFEQAVLKQTVYASGSRRWTSWLGWVAAAASLLLAATIWVISGQGSAVGPQRVAENAAQIRAPALGPPPDVQPPVNALGPSLTLARDVRRRPAGPGPDTAGTIDTTVLLLGQVLHADLSSFEDIERVRATIVYEDLQDRLAKALAALPPGDWEAARSAKWYLDRIAAGPLTIDDVRQMQRDIAQGALVSRLTNLARASAAMTSL